MNCGSGIATPLHEIKQDPSIAFRSDPSKSIPPFGGVIRSITLFFGWDICSSLSSSFGVLTACSADSLTQASLPSLAQGILNRFTATGFLIYSSCTCFGFVEVRLRGPLDSQSSIGICSISGVFSWRTGMGRFSWALQDPARNHPLVWYGTTWDSRRAYLSFFCRYRFELALLRVFVGRWKLLVDDGLWWVGSDSSMLVCRDQLRPSFRPWVTVTGKSPTSPSEMDDLHFIISSMFWLGVHGQVGIHGPLSGLDFPVRDISETLCA